VRREDIWYFLVVKGDDQANALRRQKTNGAFAHLNEYKFPEMLKEVTFSLYKASGELGVVNLAHS